MPTAESPQRPTPGVAASNPGAEPAENTAPPNGTSAFGFAVGARLAETDDARGTRSARERNDGGRFLGRTGVITTPHGSIATPAFIPVGLSLIHISEPTRPY